MIVKDNGKGQVTRRNKQTNKYFPHYKQLNTFDHSYHIHKYLDSEPSTFLLVNIGTLFSTNLINMFRYILILDLIAFYLSVVFHCLANLKSFTPTRK